MVVRVAVEHRKLSALEPLAVVYDSVRVVQLPHFRNCVVGVLVNQFYQLRLAIVFQLFQQVFVRYSQEVNQKVHGHVNMRLTIVGRIIIAAAHGVGGRLFDIGNFELDLVFDKLAEVEVARVEVGHDLLKYRVRDVVDRY